jgi:hypothetical protein
MKRWHSVLTTYLICFFKKRGREEGGKEGEGRY